VTSRTTVRFRRSLAALPLTVRERARFAYHLFAQNPWHPALQFKQVHPTEPVYSARVGLGYRALAVRDGEAVIWFWIGSHADYDQLLARL